MITLFFHDIRSKIIRNPQFKELTGKTARGELPVSVSGARGMYLAMIAEELYKYSKGPLFLLTATEKEAEDLLSDLQQLDANAVHFQNWNTLPYQGDKVPLPVLGSRVSILQRLNAGEKLIVVLSLRALVNPLVHPRIFDSYHKSFKKGDPIDPQELEVMLVDYGYSRVPRVSVPGEFALRGEVLDIFLPGKEDPTRVTFDFDEVESIKSFSISSQMSIGSEELVNFYPVSELLWNEERLRILINRLEQKLSQSESEKSQIIHNIKERLPISDEQYYFISSLDPPSSIFDYAKERSLFFLIEEERIHNAYEGMVKEYKELFKRERRARKDIPNPNELYLDISQVLERHRRQIRFPSLNTSDTAIPFSYDGPRSFFGNVQFMKEEIQRLKEIGYRIAIFSDSEVQLKRLEQLFKDLDIEFVLGRISSGFTLPDIKLMCIWEGEIFGRKKRRPSSMKKVQSEAIESFVDLNEGDYVVHINYGIGRFKGIERVKAAGTERDYIQLEYAGDETIFIPIEQVNLVQRYIGSEGRPPRLDKIGGKSWEARKGKVRKSVEDLAEHLIELYSKRKASTGHAYETDTDWQLEFEAAFPFEETEDQLTCIQEIKDDMERPLPMDRLVCGDVGYGKTEVAMRACFKAVMGGRQVAFIAPTTILAEQHYENFLERFEGFPVKIAMISRFVTKAAQKKVLAQLIEGNVDIVIGTHRVLQKDVKFKNLGLMVIDEEQRFGVKDKEKLKTLRSSVDSLSLSATPIPRTLHMSLLKIRDMSLLKTAPHNRRPIETFISEFDEEKIARAIRKEVERGGQVFFLHNRVETLDQVRVFLQDLVPEVIIDAAHGQMTSHQLEDIMHRFIHGAFQVLVATTIIENGIDIPNVNTIIIDRADMYGISQLYQLRGRVGRSDKTAYAYLMYPEKRALSELAMKRLQVISDYTELGAGFKIAMKDMEIRGAGNLLGRQQHGDILSVGFDMYMRLLDEAMRELDQEGSKDIAEEVYLEMDYTGYIPDSYISDGSEKMEIYKKIAAVQDEEELAHVFADLEDRYGPLPDEVQSLLSIAEVRILCKKLRISSLRERKGNATIEFGRVSEVSVDKVVRLIGESNGTISLDPKRPNIIKMKTDAVGLREKSQYITENLARLV
jgi:transcription-repair coupling factor (superfamily II helicase)